MSKKAKVEQVVASDVSQSGIELAKALEEVAVPSKSIVKRIAVQKKKKAVKKVVKKGGAKKKAKKAKSKKK